MVREADWLASPGPCRLPSPTAVVGLVPVAFRCRANCSWAAEVQWQSSDTPSSRRMFSSHLPCWPCICWVITMTKVTYSTYKILILPGSLLQLWAKSTRMPCCWQPHQACFSPTCASILSQWFHLWTNPLAGRWCTTKGSTGAWQPTWQQVPEGIRYQNALSIISTHAYSSATKYAAWAHLLFVSTTFQWHRPHNANRGSLHALVSDSTNDNDLNPFPANIRIKEGPAQRI